MYILNDSSVLNRRCLLFQSILKQRRELAYVLNVNNHHYINIGIFMYVSIYIYIYMNVENM